MKRKSLKPILLTAGVIAFVWLVRLLAQPGFFPDFDFFERMEWDAYDARMRLAAKWNPPVENRFGFVTITDGSIETLNNGDLGIQFGLYWPRQVYGFALRELTAAKAKAVAFDVLFAEERPDHPPVVGEGPTPIPSDEFFATQVQSNRNTILAAAQGQTVLGRQGKPILPAPAFRDVAWAIGDIGADPDSDGILRRARPYRDYHVRNSLLKDASEVSTNRIVFVLDNDQKLIIPVDREGFFDARELAKVGLAVPAGQPPRQKVFTIIRAWGMGIVMAARELGLDLRQAEITPQRITLRSPSGVQRVIPLHAEGTLFINWRLPAESKQLTQQPIELLIYSDQERRKGQPLSYPKDWKDKLVFVGSTATGNDLTDLGPTPLSKSTFLVSKHWNIARSIIENEFILPPSLALELALIALIGAIAAWLTWRLRALVALGLLVTLALVYLTASLALFLQFRIWIPVVLPLLGGAIQTYTCLITYRVIFEQREQRRIKGIFSRIVSPDVVNELLGAEKLSLGGARREVTVLFADVRGFTEFTESSQVRAEEYVRTHKLGEEEAEAIYDQQARETLETVNLYLSNVANNVKNYGGTLDKYIGDCVMAFWGAPTLDPKHAAQSVWCAVETQRAINELNQERARENKRREQENLARAANNQPPLGLLPLLALGTGINTGVVTVGLMGSEAHILNYTVFGREVNLASRLEGVSGRARIIIGEGTFKDLKRDDPILAGRCIPQPPVLVKGIKAPVKTYEVPWKQAAPVLINQQAPTIVGTLTAKPAEPDKPAAASGEAPAANPTPKA